MLDLAFELIEQAVSNSLVMFCFCNIIIVMILKGSKPELGVSEEINFSHSAGCSNMDKNSKEETDFAPVRRENDQFYIDVAETDDECEETIACDEKENGDDDDQEEDDCQEGRKDEEEEKEDELRKRVEAFIAKVNREWKNEKLRALNLQT